jgi:hypothetical protein
MEAIYLSEIDFQWTTRRYIQEDGTLHDRRFDNLKYYKIILNFKICIFQEIQNDSKLLSAVPWPVYGNTDNILE